MWAELLKYLTVFGLSMFKFVFGPITALPLGIGYVETSLLTAGGMMASVLIISSLGVHMRARFIQRFAPNRRLFTKRSRQVVRIWRKYGMWGVAMLTPLLFTPIGGTLIAVSFGERRSKILFTMLIAGLFWAFVISGAIFFAKDLVGKTVWAGHALSVQGYTRMGKMPFNNAHFAPIFHFDFCAKAMIIKNSH